MYGLAYLLYGRAAPSLASNGRIRVSTLKPYTQPWLVIAVV